jgi:hypothetical protein
LKSSEIPIPDLQVLDNTSIGLNFEAKIYSSANGPVISLTGVNVNAIHKKSQITLLSIDSVEVGQTAKQNQ